MIEKYNPLEHAEEREYAFEIRKTIIRHYREQIEDLLISEIYIDTAIADMILDFMKIDYADEFLIKHKDLIYQELIGVIKYIKSYIPQIKKQRKQEFWLGLKEFLFGLLKLGAMIFGVLVFIYLTVYIPAKLGCPCNKVNLKR